MFFQTSIIDPTLIEKKIIKTASKPKDLADQIEDEPKGDSPEDIEKVATKPEDLSDQIEDEPKGDSPADIEKVADKPEDLSDQIEDEAQGDSVEELEKITTRLNELYSLERYAKRVKRRIARTKSKQLKLQAKRLLRRIARRIKIAQESPEYVANNPGVQVMAAVRKGDLDIEEVKPIWSYVAKTAGEKANYAGCLVHFCYKYAELVASKRVKRDLPMYIVPDAYRDRVTEKLLAPRANESVEAWKKENIKTGRLIEKFEGTITEAELFVDKYIKSIVEVEEKMNRWRGSGGANEAKIPKWSKEKDELMRQFEEIQGTIKKNKATVQKVKDAKVTSIDFELEVRKIVQKAIEAHNAIFAKNMLERILNDLNDQLNAALKNIKTTNKQAGVLDTILGFISKIFNKLKEFVGWLVRKVKDYVGASDELEGIANLDTSVLMENA